MKDFVDVATDVARLVQQKNDAYGDSFACGGDFLRLLYPKGMMPNQYDDALAFIRMFDKFCRIANMPEAFSEDPYTDILGYAILLVHSRNARNEGKKIHC